MAVRQLTEDDVLSIKKLLEQGVNQKIIAMKFGVTQSDISIIKSGKRYGSYKGSGLFVYGLSQKTKETLRNIAENKGLNFSEFIRFEIQKIIETTPDNLKRKPIA